MNIKYKLLIIPGALGVTGAVIGGGLYRTRVTKRGLLRRRSDSTRVSNLVNLLRKSGESA